MSGMGRHRAPQREDRRAHLTVAGVVGELLLTVGAVLLLFVGYEVFWTNIEASKQQEAVAKDLDAAWNDENPRSLTAPQEGAAFARMYVPAFGSDWSFAVVQGVSDDDLEKGPGHYLDTAGPGEPGNFALAGHRVGRGAPFNDLGLLSACDAIVVETAGSWDIYRVLPIDAPPGERATQAASCLPPDVAQRVTDGDYAGVQGRSITTPDDVAVINPVPDQTRVDVEPGDLPLLTLTTCHPQFSNRERMIIHAVLERSERRQPGVLPAELTREV